MTQQCRDITKWVPRPSPWYSTEADTLSATDKQRHHNKPEFSNIKPVIENFNIFPRIVYFVTINANVIDGHGLFRQEINSDSLVLVKPLQPH